MASANNAVIVFFVLFISFLLEIICSFFFYHPLPISAVAVTLVSMITTYKLDTRELADSAFIDSVRTAYPNRMVEIEVRDEDATEYLMSTPANRKHLNNAIKEEKTITFASVEEARKCAEEWAAHN
jgi:hypothetical protein